MSLVMSQLRLLLAQMTSRRGPSCSCDEDSREQLLTAEHVPALMREPFILTGYRSMDKPWSYYFRSIFILHNESGNVWTHGLGFFLVLYSHLWYLGQPGVWEDKRVWPFVIFSLCCLTNLALSAIAHLFHSKSVWHHFAFFLVDYMGVTFYMFGSGVGSMYICSSKAFHEAFSAWFLPVNVFLSWFAFYACCIAKIRLGHNNTQRKYLMVAGVLCQAVIVALPTASRYVDCLLYQPTCELRSLNHLTAVFTLLILCGVMYAAHFPESLWPGCFDFLGHGHQLFHTTAVVAMLTQVWAIDLDVNRVGTARQLDVQPGPGAMLISLLGMILLEAATLLYYMRWIAFRRLSADVLLPMPTAPISHDKSNSTLVDQGLESSSDNGDGDAIAGDSIPAHKQLLNLDSVTEDETQAGEGDSQLMGEMKSKGNKMKHQ